MFDFIKTLCKRKRQMSNTLETVLLGNVKPVMEKGVALMTVLAVTSKQTVLTGADEAVVAVDGVFDLKVGQQLIVSEADAEGVWHVVGTKEAVIGKTCFAIVCFVNFSGDVYFFFFGFVNYFYYLIWSVFT